MDSKLRKAIFEAGYNLKSFSIASNCHYNSIRAYVVGTMVPGVDVALKIAKKLDKTVEEIWEMQQVED